MPNVLVRDVSESVLKELKDKASRSGRSLQAELHAILNDAAKRPKQLSDLETARRIRRMLDPKKQTDSAQMLREDRAR
jgi:plasmid stability protein